PYDDDPHWQQAPDRTLLAATPTDILLTPLKEPLT
ncbi:class II glutamine amidotransferase, partial [Streptomyces sp. NPDC048584]